MLSSLLFIFFLSFVSLCDFLVGAGGEVGSFGGGKDSGRSRRMSDVSKVAISGLTLTGLLAGGGEAKGKTISWKITFLET